MCANTREYMTKILTFKVSIPATLNGLPIPTICPLMSCHKITQSLGSIGYPAAVI